MRTPCATRVLRLLDRLLKRLVEPTAPSSDRVGADVAPACATTLSDRVVPAAESMALVKVRSWARLRVMSLPSVTAPATETPVVPVLKSGPEKRLVVAVCVVVVGVETTAPSTTVETVVIAVVVVVRAKLTPLPNRTSAFGTPPPRKSRAAPEAMLTAPLPSGVLVLPETVPGSCEIQPSSISMPPVWVLLPARVSWLPPVLRSLPPVPVKLSALTTSLAITSEAVVVVVVSPEVVVVELVTVCDPRVSMVSVLLPRFTLPRVPIPAGLNR